jgi:prepilin-type N-terminal cleavage/methylation domain-containing protein
MDFRKLRQGFTLIELLIVIAIILILISIALPNFLEAQARARLARVKGDLRSLITAVEAFRTERGVLLIDFWDDGTKESKERWLRKFGEVGRNPMYTYISFEEVFYPLTSPAKYMSKVPYDLYADPKRQVGLSGSETGSGYLYFDNDPIFPNVCDHYIDRFFPGHPLQIQSQTRPLSEGEYAILSVGPDGFLGVNKDGYERGMAFNPTNGTMSTGDIVLVCNGRG